VSDLNDDFERARDAVPERDRVEPKNPSDRWWDLRLGGPAAQATRVRNPAFCRSIAIFGEARADRFAPNIQISELPGYARRNVRITMFGVVDSERTDPFLDLDYDGLMALKAAVVEFQLEPSQGVPPGETERERDQSLTIAKQNEEIARLQKDMAQQATVGLRITNGQAVGTYLGIPRDSFVLGGVDLPTPAANEAPISPPTTRRGYEGDNEP
jgi:hypothetical protein